MFCGIEQGTSLVVFVSGQSLEIYQNYVLRGIELGISQVVFVSGQSMEIYQNYVLRHYARNISSRLCFRPVDGILPKTMFCGIELGTSLVIFVSGQSMEIYQNYVLRH
jgi:hypothetical protein